MTMSKEEKELYEKLKKKSDQGTKTKNVPENENPVITGFKNRPSTGTASNIRVSFVGAGYLRKKIKQKLAEQEKIKEVKQ